MARKSAKKAKKRGGKAQRTSTKRHSATKSGRAPSTRGSAGRADDAGTTRVHGGGIQPRGTSTRPPGVGSASGNEGA